MRLFLDSNVWVAALGTNGLCLELAETAIGLNDAKQAELMICPAAENEILRILTDKFHLNATEIEAARVLLNRIRHIPDGMAPPPSSFPDLDDWPIIAAAFEAGAELFVTGDKALLALGEVEGLPIRSPRDAYILLRGL